MAASYKECASVSPQCPVEATPYGYEPQLAGNLILCIIFGVCFILQVIFSIKGRTWTWLIGLGLGTLLECLGYVGRLLMHKNPWDDGAFKLQLITLILGPSFIAGSIDLTLKHLVLRFGQDASVIPARLYTWVFICADALSILIQAAGGGIAASAKMERKLLDAGNDVIMAGIALQVAQLAAFGVVSALYAYNVWKRRHTSTIDLPGKLKFFISLVVLAYTTILVRCIYRLPEMAAGWGKGLQRNETDFLVLDGAMVVIAASVLTIAHPTFFFPVMGNERRKKAAAQKERSSSDVSLA